MNPFARLASDAVYGLRIWRKTPGHALVAVLALSLGIGVNVAVINLIDTLFFSQPAVADPDGLVFIMGRDQRETTDSAAFSLADWAVIRERAESFEDFAAEGFMWALMTDGDTSVELSTLLVTGNYFDLLGMRPVQGRFFGVGEDEVPGRDPVAVIGYEVWRQYFSGDAGVVGKTVRLNRHTFTIIGVAPAGFSGLFAGQPYELWIPSMMSGIDQTGETYPRDFRAFDLVARRAEGRTLDENRAEMDALMVGLGSDLGVNDDRVGAVVTPIRGATTGNRAVVGRTPLLAMAVAGSLLLVTCLNLAGLVLARNVVRRREFATRRALGASRRSLLAQLMTEAFVLATVAGAVGVVSAIWTQRLIEQWYAYNLPGLQLHIGSTAILAALAMVAITAVMLGVVPAWRVSRADIVGDIKSSKAGAAGWFRDAPGRSLAIVAQVAISLMLMMGAAVMLESVEAILGSGGIDPGGVLHYRLRPSRVGYDQARATVYQQDLLREVVAMPGVESASLARVGPERGFCCPVGVTVRESAGEPDAPPLAVSNNDVTPAFFDTLGMQIFRGRRFRDTDGPGAPMVAIVNDALAELLWPGADPLGRILVTRDTQYQVIGVAPNVYPSRYGEGPVPYLYFAYWQNEMIDGRLYVRIRGGAAQQLHPVRAAVASIDPDVHIGQEGTLEDRMRMSMASEQVLMGVLRACAIAALVLSAIGLYGQLSLSVGQRTREIGIRMALGSTTGRVLSAEVGRGLRLLAIGLAVGLFATWIQARLIYAYVAGVSLGEPVLLIAVCAVLVIVGGVASLLPARRAARVDPMLALRQE